ncbi:MAG TPA: D-alanyl-D-alanine carboxypeptidase family protein [Caulobacteraceae bacterium]|nr:D-alanyl-D-alanine carboxypeptidase family protein [Caulobacteraceae bacterium]
MPEPARRASYVLAALAASFCITAAPTFTAAQSPQLQSAELRVPRDEPRYAAIVVDATTGETLYQVRADSPRYPASLTKLMTLYLAFDALSTGRLKESDLITVSPYAAAMPPTKLGLRAGATITVANAMHAMAVHSANDMAVALAEKLGGTTTRFAAMMTLKARELGMTHTRFVNPNGLPDSRHVSSAHDIAILCEALLRDFPQYYHYFGDEEFTYDGRTMRNTNHLLGQMPGVDGFKTGFTDAAGFNLAASAVRDGHRLIAVVLGGATSAQRNANVEDLLLTGFDVEQRRDRGEKILMAQNLFEQPQSGAYRVQAEPAGAGADPIDIVLTSAAHGAPVTLIPGRATELAAQRPSLVADFGAIYRARFAGQAPVERPAQQLQPRNWTVEVGTFRSGRLATRQVGFFAHRYRALFDERHGEVDHTGRRFHSIFTGFTEAEAKSACARVASRTAPCDAYGPQ